MSTVTDLLYFAACLSGVAAVAFISGAHYERRKNTEMIRRAFAEYRSQRSAGTDTDTEGGGQDD